LSPATLPSEKEKATDCMNTMNIMLLSLCTILLATLTASYIDAEAHVMIWQVEANPAGPDTGNEWLTILNVGSSTDLSGWYVQTTNGKAATAIIPDVTLNKCEYHKVTYQKQAIDNQNEQILLYNSEHDIVDVTPLLFDTQNNDDIWERPHISYACTSQGKLETGTKFYYEKVYVSDQQTEDTANDYYTDKQTEYMNNLIETMLVPFTMTAEEQAEYYGELQAEADFHYNQKYTELEKEYNHTVTDFNFFESFHHKLTSFFGIR
jgi:hypothetical protein